MKEATQIIADQVAERMRQISAFRTKKDILFRAFIILQELGEIEISNHLLKSAKKMGDKLKDLELPVIE